MKNSRKPRNAFPETEAFQSLLLLSILLPFHSSTARALLDLSPTRNSPNVTATWTGKSQSLCNVSYELYPFFAPAPSLPQPPTAVSSPPPPPTRNSTNGSLCIIRYELYTFVPSAPRPLPPPPPTAASSPLLPPTWNSTNGTSTSTDNASIILLHQAKNFEDMWNHLKERDLVHVIKIRYMDSQQEELFMHSPGNTNESDASDAPASSSKKRGPTRGASLDVRPEIKKLIRTNEDGQPNEKCPNHKDFTSHIGVLTRAHVKIIYTDIRQVPKSDIQMVTNTLSWFYEFEDQSWEASLEYIEKRINEAWRNYKSRLAKQYIKGNDLASVREGPAPPGIPIEDWRIFVDNRNTEQFKRISAINKNNRAKLKEPACLGRCSMAVLRHQMAMERNLTFDDEVSRIDVYLKAHTSKDNVIQFPELAEKLKEIYSTDPASQMTGIDDALAQFVGPDSRGRMRGLGCAISKTGFKKSAPTRSKVKALKTKNEMLTNKIVDIEKTVADVKAWQDAYSSQNPSPHSTARSTQSSSVHPDRTYIGKRCELLGWGKRGVVGHGRVHEVDSSATIHGQPLEDGAFIVVVTEILQPNAALWKEDPFASTLEEAGVGSIVQWGKDSLRIK